MKTLRMARNIAALVILGATFVLSRPGAVFSQQAAAVSTVCTTKVGYYACIYNPDGTCSDAKCASGASCANLGCVKVSHSCDKPKCF